HTQQLGDSYSLNAKKIGFGPLIHDSLILDPGVGSGVRVSKIAREARLLPETAQTACCKASRATSMAFRRINVDQFDEDHSISPNELIPENPLSDQDLAAKVQATASQVRSFLQRG